MLWQIGLYVVDGRTLVEQAQNLFTTFGQRPPGTTILKSYTAMTGQCDVTLSPVAEPEPAQRVPEADREPRVRLCPRPEPGFVEELLAAADASARATTR